MKSRVFPFRVVLALAVFPVAPMAVADTVALPAIADTSIFSGEPNNNWGGANFFNAGTARNGGVNRALLHFDLGGTVPPGSTIVNVTLNLDVVREPAAGRRDVNFSLRRMLVSWGEGAQAPVPPADVGLPAVPGEASWLNRFGNSQPWGQPGGQEGVDYSAGLSATAFVYGVGDPVEFTASPAMLADVQFWLDNPALNFGWMFRCEEESAPGSARSFASRELGFAPTLIVEFIPVPEPAVVVLLAGGLLGLLVARRRR